jgi:Carboxypeptidase regulatory-like domain
MTSQISLIVLSVLLGLCQAEGSSKGNLHGIVRDPQGAVVSLPIEIVADAPSENGGKVVVTTDQFGKYLTDLAAGQYKACARKRGFEESCRCVRIEEGRDTEVDFSMRIDKAYVLLSDYDVMDRRLQTLAGNDAINCGHAHVEHSPHKETACGLNANKRKKAFYVRYDVPCGDCELSVGLATDALGRVFAVHFDSMGMSTWELDAAEAMPDGIFTVVAPCPPRPGLRVTSTGALSCFSPRDKLHNIMQQLDEGMPGGHGRR